MRLIRSDPADSGGTGARAGSGTIYQWSNDVAVPKRRKSKAKSAMRWAHEALATPNLRPCPNCGTYGLPHRVCGEYIQYKNHQIRTKKVQVTEA